MVDCAPSVLSAKLGLWQPPYIFFTSMKEVSEKFKPHITNFGQIKMSVPQIPCH